MSKHSAKKVNNLSSRVKYHCLLLIKLIFSGLRWLVELGQPDKRNQIPKTTSKLLLTPASELVSQIKAGKLKSRDVVQEYIDRIKVVNPIINAVIDERFASALREAQQLDSNIADAIRLGDKHGLLKKHMLGVPVSVKDSLSMKGSLCTAGSYYRKDTVAEDDCYVVSRLKESGAIPVCVTNVPELLLWWDTTNIPFGTTSNPYDTSRIPGGSSGGEAALISSCGSIIGAGSDLGGSLRFPSLFCGIFAHKPSSWVVPMTGMWPEPVKGFNNVGGFGPLCRYASDLKLGLKAMADPLELEKLRLDEPVDLSNVKVLHGYSIGPNPLVSELSEDIERSIQQAVSYLKNDVGCDTERVEFPEMARALNMWSAVLKNEEPRDLGEFVGADLSSFSGWAEMAKSVFRQSNHTFSILTMIVVLDKLGMKRGTKKFRRTLQSIEGLQAAVNKKLGDNCVLLFPTFTSPPPKQNTTHFYGVDATFCSVFNVLEMPCTQVPMGLDKNGLPVGFQVVARPHNDRLTIAVAEELERAFGGWVAPWNSLKL